MSEKETINRLYNCKFESAFEEIKRSKFKNNNKILKVFEKASNDLGNCGWGGKLIENTTTRLAKLIGYEWDDEIEFFKKRK